MLDENDLEQYRGEDGFIHLGYRCPEPKSFAAKQRFNKSDRKEIVFHHGYISITNYKKGDCWELEKTLSVWDKMYFKYRLVGGYYIKELKEFRINRGFNIGLLNQLLPNYPMRVENDPYPADKIDIELYAGPKSDFQRVALTFMTSHGIYEKNQKFTQQMIDAQTGEGKTYCGCATAAFFNRRVIIIVPFAKLLNQWRESFTSFTSIKNDEIMIVQGGDACQKIIDGKCKDIKVFIFMVDTIASYQKRYGDLQTIEMLRNTNAYVKIVDEVHRDMKSISMIEALSNFHMNYYMSASPGRSEKKENWIFKSLYKNIPRFGSSFKNQDEKHINIMIKQYLWTPTGMQIKGMVNNKTGLNTKAFERELIASDPIQRQPFDNALRMMLAWSKKIIKPKNKLMILAQSIDTLHFLQPFVEEAFPGESRIYYGGMKKKEKEAALEEGRILIATSSSLGTGADIPGLQILMNVSTYSNPIDAVQIPGRLRKLKDGTPVVYIEFVDVGYRKTLNQYMYRKSKLIDNTKSGKLIVIN